MTIEQISKLPVLRGLLRLISSSRFIVLFLAALAASGLNIHPEWQAFIIFAAAGIYALSTAYEDAAKDKALAGNEGGGQTNIMSTEPTEVTVNQPPANSQPVTAGDLDNAMRMQ